MPSSLEQRLKDLITGPGYRPMNKSELSRALEIPPKNRAEFRQLLRQLESEGAIRQVSKGRYATPGPAPAAQTGAGARGGALVGTIRFHPRGHAFFLPDFDAGENRDAGLDPETHSRIFVPARQTGTALHGDRVAVRIAKTGAPPRWHRHVKRKRELLQRIGEDAYRTEARVVRILSRKSQTILGIYREKNQFRYFVPRSDLFPHTFELNPSPLDGEAKNGDLVSITLDEWISPSAHPRGSITRVLGPPGTPGIDILSIIVSYQLPLAFPDEVLREADAVPGAVSEEELTGREDWRSREVFTIDPSDARDFDDAICVTALAGGGWELAVHIADVSHYVKPGTALDREARRRGNSVYLVDRVLPMLPENLSNGICSLKPGVDRLTRAVIMSFDGDGRQTAVRFAAAVIRSAVRLSYEEAYELLKPNLNQEKTEGNAEPVPVEVEGALPKSIGDTPNSLASHLHAAWDLASRLRRNRFREGALDLDMPEIRVVLDSSGRPIDLVRVDYDESHQLIEEFMLAANDAVAKATKVKQLPSIYRIHEDPDADKLFEFRQVAHIHGYAIGDLSVRGELQKLLEMIRGQPEERLIKIALLKSLKRAVYHADPLGHYGLAKSDYTHFTSPIRRYADLIVHRVLSNILLEAAPGGEGKERTPVPPYADLMEIARHISDTERNAADAEEETRKLKQLEFFYHLSRAESPPIFDALLLEVGRAGIFAELTEFFVKGLVKKEDLPPNEDWYLDLQTQTAYGRRPKVQYRAGDVVKVSVARVDLEKKFIDFRIGK